MSCKHTNLVKIDKNTNFIKGLDFEELRLLSCQKLMAIIMMKNININGLYYNNKLFQEKNLHIRDLSEDKINQTYDLVEKLKPQIKLPFMCLHCGIFLLDKTKIDEHFNSNPEHVMFLSLDNYELFCTKCKKNVPVNQEIEIAYMNLLFDILAENFFPPPQIFDPNDLDLDKISNKSYIKYLNVINKFKNNKYGNISVICGSQISSPAGVPDVRNDTDYFADFLDKYDADSVADFFVLEKFLQNPEIFVEFLNIFDPKKFKPTMTHIILSFLFSKYPSFTNLYTENIDGLELASKIPENKICFSFGNMMEGHCPKCQNNVQISLIFDNAKKNQVYKCPNCGGPCKPHVVLFGEKLSPTFFTKCEELRKSDLVIILGTNLEIAPFDALIDLIDKNTDVVVLNTKDYLHDDFSEQFKFDELCQNALVIEDNPAFYLYKFIEILGLKEEFKSYFNTNFTNLNYEEYMKREEMEAKTSLAGSRKSSKSGEENEEKSNEKEIDESVNKKKEDDKDEEKEDNIIENKNYTVESSSGYLGSIVFKN